MAYRFVTGKAPDGDVSSFVMPDQTPEQLWAFVLAAMDLDPQKRPANAGAVMPMLEGIQVAPKPQREMVVLSRQTGGGKASALSS